MTKEQKSIPVLLSPTLIAIHVDGGDHIAAVAQGGQGEGAVVMGGGGAHR